jgi:autotransporter-associated beta strand protein
VAFNIYNGNNETQGTNIAANGVAAGGTPNSLTTPQTHNYLATPGLNNTGGVASGDPIQVTLQYDGSNNLTETLTDLTTSGTWTNTYAIGRIATTAAGGTAYVGFTGADGGATSTQTISNFSLTYPTNTLPAATALYIGSSGTVDLSGNSQQVESLRNLAAGSSGTVINSGATASVLSLAPTGTSLFSGSIDGVDSTSPISLVLDGPGKQILSGVNTFTGGTTVESGTLVLGSPTALLTGSSLAVGNGASSLFAPATAGPAVAAGPASAAAVPEPGTLALAAIAAALLSVAAWRRRRS